jgi:hypothetical protein
VTARGAPRIALGAVLFACGCAPSAPRIAHPVSVRSFCGTREARLTGIASVITSTSDVLLGERLTLPDVERAVQSGDGVIAYWNAQPLLLPRVSKELGETDGYVRVYAAGVPPTFDLATNRKLYLLVRAGTGKRWIALTAYDAQDVCVEGHRDV